MASKLNPYINFRGQAREAAEFYKSVFGGTLTISTFGEAGMPVEPDEANQVMHAQLIADNSITLMLSDTPKHMDLKEGSTISVSLSGDDEAELTGYWNALSAGATVDQPLQKAPWGDTFGMLTDSFGIRWLVNISGSKQ